MCIKVKANGSASGDGAGTHVSVFVHLMRGEYDNRLVWPFRGDIAILLVNHSSNQNHGGTLSLNDDTAAGKRVTSGERADIGRGISQFITHTMTESCTSTRRYINNDCLTFRITKIVVRSV